MINKNSNYKTLLPKIQEKKKVTVTIKLTILLKKLF